MSKKHHNRPTPEKASEPAPTEEAKAPKPSRWVVLHSKSFLSDDGVTTTRVHAGKVITTESYANLLSSKGVELEAVL